MIPESMSIAERNARLYETLKGMGLVVSPIPDQDAPEQIAALWVSVALPPQERRSEQAAVAGVLPATERPQVGNVIASAEALGDGVVVHFPTVRG